MHRVWMNFAPFPSCWIQLYIGHLSWDNLQAVAYMQLEMLSAC